MAFSAAASLHAGLYRPIAEVRRQRAGLLGLLGSGLHLRAKPGPGQLSKLGNYCASKSGTALKSLPLPLGLYWDYYHYNQPLDNQPQFHSHLDLDQYTYRLDKVDLLHYSLDQSHHHILHYDMG